MPNPGTVPNRRFLLLLLAAVGLVSLLSWTFSGRRNPDATFSSVPIHQVSVDDDMLKGNAIMGKIGNETVKADLGRAAWKLLHTTMAKFPDKPSQDEQTALFSYIHLFARLYPCGECAGHFRQILNQFPPQVSSRSSAAAWACHVHNEVNKSLQKELFDCSNIGDFYDCGCAEEDERKEKKATNTDRIDLQVEKLGYVSTKPTWNSYPPTLKPSDWAARFMQTFCVLNFETTLLAHATLYALADYMLLPVLQAQIFERLKTLSVFISASIQTLPSGLTLFNNPIVDTRVIDNLCTLGKYVDANATMLESEEEHLRRLISTFMALRLIL